MKAILLAMLIAVPAFAKNGQLVKVNKVAQVKTVVECVRVAKVGNKVVSKNVVARRVVRGMPVGQRLRQVRRVAAQCH